MEYQQLSAFVVLFSALLAIKHLAADGFLQTPYQYRNKGKLLHPGGYIHAGFHGILTAASVRVSWWLVFEQWLSPVIVVKFMLFDAISHYIIDYAKVNLSNKSWSDVHTSEGVTYQRIFTDKFYYVLIADQSAHFYVYGLMIAAAILLRGQM